MIQVKKMTTTVVMALMAVTAMAQMMNPVHFKSELKTGKGAEAEIVFTATIDDGWHVYSTDLGNDGPIEATFNIEKMDQLLYCLLELMVLGKQLPLQK